MNINEFLKRHNFGAVEKDLLISIIEHSETAIELSENIAETFKIQLNLSQVEALRNSWYSEYNSR
jgi:hypothetical protein